MSLVPVVLVDASRFPGPAIWQALMLLIGLPLGYWGVWWREGKYFRWFCLGYALIGLALFALIVWLT